MWERVLPAAARRQHWCSTDSQGSRQDREETVCLMSSSEQELNSPLTSSVVLVLLIIRNSEPQSLSASYKHQGQISPVSLTTNLLTVVVLRPETVSQFMCQGEDGLVERPASLVVE